MDKIGKETYIATKNWTLLDWKDFRYGVFNYYTIKNKAYLSKIPKEIIKFRKLKLKLILEYNGKRKQRF